MNGQPDTYALSVRAGLQRDGTKFASDKFINGRWVRFHRGTPQKIGGYRNMTDLLSGPVRELYVDSRGGLNTAHAFSEWGIERLQFDNTGVGGAITNRTNGSFTHNANLTWTTGVMWDAGGSATSFLYAAATPDLDSLASDTAGPVYYGDILGTGAFSIMPDATGNIAVSGGVTVIGPFVFVYGSNGLIRNSDVNKANSAAGWTTGGSSLSNTANVAGTKIVFGLPLRGGSNAPAGLFWALDALIRVSFVGSAAGIFRYDTVSDATTVMSKKAIVEYDGIYYWPGTDRFFGYDGTVHELPNDVNLDYFYDNINYTQRSKVWATRVPRYGEIWWFYPRGNSTECNAAIVYNIREQSWSDAESARGAGSSPKFFPYPVWVGSEDGRSTIYLTVGTVTGTFSIGQTLTGATSGAVGTITKVNGQQINVTTTGSFANGEVVSSTTGSATTNAIPQTMVLDTLWQQEFGVDKIHGQDVTAIKSNFETNRTTFALGGPGGKQAAGLDVQTRIIRVEPDFIQVGDMTCTVNGVSYAQGPEQLGTSQTFSPNTPFVSFRDQRREVSLIFESNVVGGYYEAGQIIISAEQGDARGNS